MAYTINTQAAITAVHKAHEQAKHMLDGYEKDELVKLANSAMSATLVYLRNPHPPVQKKHYDAVQQLYVALGEASPEEVREPDSA